MSDPDSEVRFCANCRKPVPTELCPCPECGGTVRFRPARVQPFLDRGAVVYDELVEVPVAPTTGTTQQDHARARLNALIAAVEDLCQYVVDEDRKLAIVVKTKLDRAKGVAKRNKDDLASGAI